MSEVAEAQALLLIDGMDTLHFKLKDLAHLSSRSNQGSGTPTDITVASVPIKSRSSWHGGSCLQF